MKNLLQAIAAAATAIVGGTKVFDLVAGTNLITSWWEALLLFILLFVSLYAVSRSYLVWTTRKSTRARALTSAASVFLVAMCVTVIVRILSSDAEEKLGGGFRVVVFLTLGVTLVGFGADAWTHYRHMMKTKCPLCKEKIHREAVRCKHCHSSLVAPDPQPAPEPVAEPRVLLHLGLPLGVEVRVERRR